MPAPFCDDVHTRWCALQSINMSWNKLVELPKCIFDMFWLQRLTIDNNCITALSEDMGLLVNLEILWIGMNQIKRCASVNPR
jgi:Leucine-rich repeat (LRR) protein